MKSNVSDHLEMATSIYRDACAKCIAEVSDLRDLDYIRSRVKDEGLSFLTITLPSFARDFEQSLQIGSIGSLSFRSFRKYKAIPAFLRGMLSQLFNHETGRIYEQSDRFYADDRSVVVDSIRQICLAFEKLELDCSPDRVARSFANFAQLEHSFLSFSPPEEDQREFNRVSSVLWDNLMVNFDLSKVRPRHGPGGTAEHVSGNQKYVWRIWHDRLEPFFPIIDSAYSISAVDSQELQDVTIVLPELEQPVRVVGVPKTLKGPRIIAIEPCCMQYAQQAIRRELYSLIESYELTKGHVNFRDQSVNQSLAILSSKTGQLATIDLSDASDRVPRDLALEMFRSNPDLVGAIDACRSTRAEMPDGTIIDPLRKFASMGSALCFPVESMYFYTICVAALLKSQNLPVSHDNILKVIVDVYVYGDDIIVPSTHAITVLEYLQKYNCKVNLKKTFLNGSFRESCGVDAFDGELVTPTYLRKLRPKNRRQASELISWVETANLFYKKGYWETAQLMWHTCERVLGPLPYVSDTSSALGRVSFLGYRSAERWNRSLQRFELKAWSPRPIYRSDSIDGYSALQKSLSRLEGFDSSIEKLRRYDPLHLERSALHGGVALTLRWVPST